MSLQNYFDQYEKAHQHPGNRFFHSLGIPLIIISIILLIFTDYQNEGWVLFALGWVFQFVGHLLEKSWPEFMKNPVFLVIGPLYFANKIAQKLRSTK